MAAKTSNTKAVFLLIQMGADPNDAMENGFTALTYAVLSENLQTIELLLQMTSQYLDITLRKLAESRRLYLYPYRLHKV